MTPVNQRISAFSKEDALSLIANYALNVYLPSAISSVSTYQRKR